MTKEKTTIPIKELEKDKSKWIQPTQKDIEKREKAINEAIAEELSFSKRLDSKVKIRVLCFYGRTAYFHKAKIINDHYLVFKPKSQKKKKLLVIAHEPTIFTMRHILKMRSFMIWFCNFDSVATHRGNAESYNYLAVRNTHRYISAITESDILKLLAEKLKGRKGFWENLPIILLVVSNLAWMYYTFEIIKLFNPIETAQEVAREVMNKLGV